jgi:hypothetical protein
MFSDVESCDFGLEGSRILHPDRLARLLLVKALALRWAVSTGMWETAHQSLPVEKSPGATAEVVGPQPPLRGVWRE